MSKKYECHFLETYLIKYGLYISEMEPESGKVKSVVFKFYINWEKKRTWVIMLQENKQKMLYNHFK